MKNIILIVFGFFTLVSYSQNITWTGNAGDFDFFNENNWIDNSNNTTPTVGSINPNSPINLALNLQDSDVISANGVINLGTGSLLLENTELLADEISNGTITLNMDSYINLTSSTPLSGTAEINFNSSLAWVRILDVKPQLVNTSHLNKFKVNQQSAVHETNLRLDNYYLNGTIVRSIDNSLPLSIFSEENFSGNTSGLEVDNVYSSANIPNNLNDATNSFRLKKGYMVTFAVNDDGTGKSKNYIASEEDLEIDILPIYLRNDISFIRVLPWNWVQKKGRSGTDTSDLENTWFYLWNNNGNATIDLEYAPMSWGAGGADDDSDILLYQSKYKATHVLGFNESDNCNDQSGQFNNLCQVDVAVGYYENLMKSGLRLVSPNGRENAPFGWLKDFYDLANQQDVRIDVIGVHWYDWGSNPQNSPNANPNEVFQRFVTYLQNVYDLYGLPIWITEFNANPNRTNAVNYQFMQLALPYLESLDYVERYVWFQPNSDVADYYDSSGNLNNIGTFYKNQVSTPSIPETTISANSSLDNYAQLLDPTGENLLINGFFETQDLTGWSGTNIAILNNAFDGESSARIMANPGELYQDVDVEPNTIYDLSFYTKWFVTPNNPIEVKILNADTDELIATQMMGTSTNWNFIELEFTTPNDVNEIKFLVEKGNQPGWFIDNAVLLKVQTLSINPFDSIDDINIYPNPSFGKINITSSHDIQNVKVFDMLGRLAYIKNGIEGNSMDLSSLQKGIYILNISDNNGKMFNHKLILK
jgi:hypothetical protein